MPDLDAVFLVREPPTICIEDGMFHVCYRIGKRAQLEVVMAPRVFIATRLLAEEVRAQWQLSVAESSNVSKLRRK